MTEPRDEAIQAAARAANPGEFWDWPNAGPGVVTQRELWLGVARRGVTAAVPHLLDDLTQRIEREGREVVQFLAGDETKEGRYRLVGAEDAYKDALAVVEKYRNEWAGR